MQIIPAIIPKSYQDLEENLQVVKDLVNYVHIDITDGSMGGKESWPLVNDRGEFKKIQVQEMGLPFWEDFDFEVHLMTADPLAYAKEWIDAGATRIIVHVESLNYENDIQFLDQLKSQGIVEIGIAINADTEVEELKNYYHVADFIQVMTIPKIGLQGAEFDQRGVHHIEKIKEDISSMVVSVDGSINDQTILLAIDAGAERAVVGSYIFKNENPREALEELKNLS